MSRGGRWSAVERELKVGLVQAAYEDDPQITYAALEERTGITRPTLRRLYRELGLTKGGSRHRPQFRKLSARSQERLVEGYLAGAGANALAQEFGVSYSTIYAILHERRVPLRGMGCGANHPSWRGGRHQNDDGYIELWMDPVHPYGGMRKADGYVFEHRLVMAEHMGRPLLHTETVHHINGDRADNRTENLQLRRSNHGPGSALRCRSCGSCDIVEEEIDE